MLRAIREPDIFVFWLEYKKDFAYSTPRLRTTPRVTSVPLQMKPPDILTYRDYRRFLAEYYEYKKHSEYGFSYRRFARRVGYSSPNYLKLVTNGTRRVSPTMARRMGGACGLNGQRLDYFCDLVAYCQARTDDQREFFYEKLRRHTLSVHAYELDEAHAAYHSQWYIPAIRELAAMPGFRSNPEWIAEMIRPAISPAQARRALEVLVKLGLLTRVGGKLQQSSALVSTGNDGPLGRHIVKYHQVMLERAAEALELIPREEREVACLTLCVSEERVEAMRNALIKLRDEFFVEAEGCTAPAQVVQVNFQMFPLSRKGPRNA